MSLSLQEVEHIARLARLTLSDAEKAHYREQLSAILDHVAKLAELDTSDVPPMSSVFGEQPHLRADRPRSPLPADAVLRNAPEQAEGQFKIPPVFDPS
ncbi:MAG: Asp-tRNA(Asn)/Glu-tRNA(Gln) amidotransferase subunit GatC [Anaerolineales bacterium]